MSITQHYSMKKLSILIPIVLLLSGSLLVSAIPPESEKVQRLHNYLASNQEYVKTMAGMKALRAAESPVVGVATHRAANEFAPENTLAAMQIALDFAVDYIEIDVRQTKDGKSLILHDGNLDRTTNGKGPLRHLTFDEARGLSAGAWFDPFFAAERIPTLEESCRLVAEHNNISTHKTYFYVDCKDINVRELIDNLEKYRLLDNSVFYINEEHQIADLRNVAPNARIMPGLRSRQELDHTIDTYHPYALDIDWQDLSKELIERAHAKGVKVFSDGFGDNQNIGSYVQAIQYKIDVISTNKVSVLCEAAEATN